MKKLTKIILLIFSSILLTLPLTYENLFFLAWLGFLPALQVFLQENNLKITFKFGWLWGWLLALGATYWLFHPINDFSGLPLPLVLLVLIILFAATGLFNALWAVIFKILTSGNNKFSVFIFAFSWVSMEFIRGLIFPYYPFGFIGLTQTGFDSIFQLAEIGGTYLITFLTLFISGLIFKFFRNKKGRYLLAVIIVLLTSYFYSSHLVNEVESTEAELQEMNFGIVTTEIDQEEKWQEENIERNLEIIAQDISKLFAEGAEVVITPETSLTFDYLRNEYYRDQFYEILEPQGHYMIGSQSRGEDLAGNYNSYFLLDADREVLFRYNKNDLIPGEIIPFSSIVEFFTGREWHSLTPGSEKTKFSFNTINGFEQNYRVLTCSEILYAPDDYDQLEEIDMIINPSNEAWFGDSNLQNQMWQAARMRAIETRTPVLKAGNKAYSGYISPLGEEQTVSQSENLTVSSGGVFPEKTFYQQYGDYPGYFSLISILVIIPGLKLIRAGD